MSKDLSISRTCVQVALQAASALALCLAPEIWARVERSYAKPISPANRRRHCQPAKHKAAAAAAGKRATTSLETHLASDYCLVRLAAGAVVAQLGQSAGFTSWHNAATRHTAEAPSLAAQEEPDTKYLTQSARINPADCGGSLVSVGPGNL